ncbi:MAG: glycosyltransferase family 39 protein [Bacteroidetes bacterium]|nr:glycosyltransferase family 39 protein [Bacteroidota bacterium]
MLKGRKLVPILGDIRFWILLFFFFRLVGITNAPLESGHSWRQCLTNMIARNFSEGGPDILYPRIDMAGDRTGIIGSEFPFYNYLIYLLSSLFGYAHWYGRIINLLISSIGTYYFFLLAGKLSDRRIAFSSTIILLCSIWFGYSRKIMPDTLSVSLVIIGLFYGYQYLYSNSLKSLLLFMIFSGLGVLCKIPAMSLMAAIPVILLVKEIPAKRKLIVAITGLLCLFPAFMWYFYWVPYLVQTYHYQLYFPKGLMEGIREILPLTWQLFEKFYFSSLFSYLAFGFFVAGVYYISRSKTLWLKLGLAMISLIFLAFIIKTGAVFPLHSYYIIPFTPVMAFIAGHGIAKLPLKFQYIPLLIIALEGIGNQQHDFFLKPSELYKLRLESKMEKWVGKNEKIVINGGPSPQEIYFANRKGWTINSEQINLNNLEEYRKKGARYLVIDKHLSEALIPEFPVIYSDPDFSISLLERK